MTQQLAEQLRHARAEGGAFLLPPRLLIRLSGSDAFRYLNGQITRDLGRLESGSKLASCILTPKGKLCATLLIYRDGDDLIVESDPRLEEALMARLERYIVADDVTLILEASRPTIHLFGKLLEEEPWSSLQGLRVMRLGTGDLSGLDVPASQVKSTTLSLLDEQVVEALRIERGIPEWGSELSEETLPPEAGLDLTHIDYDRGCYPGQEVISRIKSVGRVNRLLHLFEVIGSAGTSDATATTSSFAAGATLHSGERGEGSEGSELGSKVGSITSVAPHLDSSAGILALGYLGRGATEPLFALDPLTGEKTPLTIVKSLGS